MALEFISTCGEHLTAAQKSGLGKWDVFQDCVIDATGGVDGGACLDSSLAPYTRVRVIKKISLSPVNSVIFGGRWYSDIAFPLTGFGTYVVAAIHYGGGGAYSFSTKQLSLNITADGYLYVRRGNYSGTTLATATTALVGLTWYYLEMKVVVHPSAGSIQLLVDDVEFLNVTGLNTQALGTTAIDAVEYIPWRIDDVYIMSTTARTGNPYVTFLGKNLHVIPNRMQSMSQLQWTPPSGLNNLQAVNDATPAGTYSEASVAGTTDLFIPTLLPPEVTTVIAVQSNLTAKKLSGTYSARLADVAEVGGVPYAAPYKELTTMATDHLTMLASAPDNPAVAWTRDQYNASRRGFRRIA
jgi:hypothetical protein